MFDPRELLGALVEGGVTRSTGTRLGHAMGPEGLGQEGGPLGGLVGQLGGALGAGGGQGGLAGLAGGILGDISSAVKGGNPAAIGGLGALAGALLGGGGKATRGALGGGAMALLGVVAMSAFKAWSASQQAPGQAATGGSFPSPQPPAAALPDQDQALQERALLLIRAMANAVKSDGQVDPGEMRRIAEKVNGTGDDQAAQAFLLQELQGPMDLEGLVRAVRSPEEALQVYAASLLAIEIDTQAERDYLRQLANGLRLDSTALAQVHQALGVKV
jgi:uncharacterized membrane protein YebE (DUF533 family)